MRLWPEGGGAPVTVAAEYFVGRGGQGAVFARGGVAYKVFDDPSGVPPPAKIGALRRIHHDAVLTPRHRLLDSDGRAVGYAMPFAPDASPLCRLYPAVFRRRHGVGVDRLLALFDGLRRALDAIHAAGVIAVDVNGMNALVDRAFDRVVLIDTDSYQTPEHPATAIMDTIRDRHAPLGHFDEGTDWFALAVVGFQLFCGMHPYRGTHPTVKGLDARMRADLSVFDPAVVRPPTCGDLGALPRRLRAWFEAVFERRLRAPPPADPGAIGPLTPGRAGSPTAIHVVEERTFAAPVRAQAARGGTTVVVADGVYVHGHRVADAPPGPVQVAFGPDDRPVVARCGPDGLSLFDPVARRTLAFGLDVEAISAAGGRLFGKSGAHLVEIALHRAGETLIAAPRTVARLAPYAARLFPGVVVQPLLGATYVGLLTDGGCRMVHAPPLDGLRIIDAVGADGVVAALARRGVETVRITLRFASDGRFDAREDPVDPGAGLDLVALATGVCLHRTGAALELFHRRPGDVARKIVDAPELLDCRLVARGSTLAFSRNRTIGTLRLRG